MTDKNSRSGISRRDVIRRGAIIGGVAWSAPIVQSLTSPAFAAGSEAEEGICDRYIFVKYNLPGTDPANFTGDEGVGNITCLNALDAKFDGLVDGKVNGKPLELNQVTGSSTVGNTTTASITNEGTITGVFNPTTGCVTVTVPADCRIIAYILKLGGGPGCDVNSVVTPASPLPQTYEFCATKLSHVDMLLCCND